MSGINYSELPQIAALIRSGVAVSGNATLSREFNRYITDNFPWAGQGLWWEKLRGWIQTDAARLSDEQLGAFFDATTLADYPAVFVSYGFDEAGVELSYRDLPRYFDDLVRAPQLCYFIGAERRTTMRNGLTPRHPWDFVEYRVESTLQLTGFLRTPSRWREQADNP